MVILQLHNNNHGDYSTAAVIMGQLYTDSSTAAVITVQLFHVTMASVYPPTKCYISLSHATSKTSSLWHTFCHNRVYHIIMLTASHRTHFMTCTLTPYSKHGRIAPQAMEQWWQYSDTVHATLDWFLTPQFEFSMFLQHSFQWLTYYLLIREGGRHSSLLVQCFYFQN